ncbi:MAG: acyl carrier protein [Streptomyces sp.]|uniref:acyl carrier protein n=1 Tax=Streptomyces sp. TaxID=1931 RepID=UPI0025D7066C|nr:acyl carrier protein [Streptomyces sp.]MBW8795404.1 acyl carrier protein [Streptomyces sp.]
MHQTDALGQSRETDVEERLRKLLGEIIGDHALITGISGDTDIVNDLGLDSIQMINFLLRLEDEFDVELDFEHLTFDQLGSLRELGRFVLAEAGRPS